MSKLHGPLLQQLDAFFLANFCLLKSRNFLWQLLKLLRDRLALCLQAREVCLNLCQGLTHVGLLNSLSGVVNVELVAHLDSICCVLVDFFDLEESL